MRARTLMTGITAVAALVVIGCGDDDRPGASATTEPAIKVVATTTQVADLARNVGGDRVQVVQLLQPNSDPHDYEPRPRDLQDATGAELLLESGDELDEWATDVAARVGLQDAVVTAGAGRPVVLDGFEHEEDGEEHAEEEGEEEHGDVDPHWWHDPRNAQSAVAVIERAFAKADPDGAVEYRERAAAYTDQLRALDRALAACLEAVPAAQRRLVSDHDAFGYLAGRYGIEIVGAVIPSTTTQAQPSAGELSRLARTIERERVRTIFPESSLNPKLAEAVARTTGATVGGTLYADTLGPEGSAGETYLQAQRANVDTLVKGFTGTDEGCDAAS